MEPRGRAGDHDALKQTSRSFPYVDVGCAIEGDDITGKGLEEEIRSHVRSPPLADGGRGLKIEALGNKLINRRHT